MQGPDGKTFRTEAAKTFLALTQNASQVDAGLVDVARQRGLTPPCTARAHTGRGRCARRIGRCLERGASECQGRAAADALAVALAATPGAKTVERGLCRRRERRDPQSRENALAFLQNATVRPAGTAAVAAAEPTGASQKFARRGSPRRPRRPGRRLRGVRAEPVGGGDVFGLYYCDHLHGY